MTTYTLPVLRLKAVNAINTAAAEARMRHITGYAGQDMVYAAKLSQAQAYLAAYAIDTGATVPGYVAAEVAAVGGTAEGAADAIVAAADAFHSGPGPDIEHARRAGKAAVLAASTAQDVAAALADALDALAAI